MRIRALLISLIIIVASIDTMFAQTNERTLRLQQRRTAQKERSDSIKAARDTMSARYPISQTAPETLNDLTPGTLDLHTPSNIVTDTIYNPEDSSYTIRTTLGKESQLGTPIKLRQKEYAEWHLSQSMMRYFREKNRKEFEDAQGKSKFDFTDMYFDLGPAEKIFGPGGVRIKTQGSAELKIGYSMQSIDNPSLPQRSRNTNSFDFDEKINLSIRGSVGDKMNLNLNYNTEATFSYDAQKLNLKYDGKEDEVIKLLEAGNVSFSTKSGLIRGASSLFGIRADFQFGKLSLQTVISQKKSSSTTVSSKGGTQLTTFEIEATNYDENRHFFLAHYFRDNYDRSMAQLPTIMSGVTINRVEVWITNKTSDYTNPRNIVAFTDLGESNHISNDRWQPAGGGTIPHNNANNLYSTLNSTYSISQSQ